MLETVNEKISVVMVSSKKHNKAYPYKMRWKEREIVFSETTYHHMIREGRLVSHIFHTTDKITDYKLSFDTQNLSWRLLEVSDGNS